MQTLARSLTLAACLAAAAALAPVAALAADAHATASGGHSIGGGGWRGGNGGWHGNRGWRGDHWGHRGFVYPGVFWGGIGLGLGTVGYYGGWWGPYGYAPYYYYGGYYDEPAPTVMVYPGTAGPATPSGQPVPPASRSPDPIFYPNKGQSAATAESDRRECNRWATTQSGALADASIFQRATLACMEGRGYTVK